MSIDVDSIKKHVPYYLTAEDQTALISELRAYSDGKAPNFYHRSDEYEDEMLQGDAWSGLEIVVFDSMTKKRVRGLVLSNSCDVDPANKRDLPFRVVFAPLVTLDKYKGKLSAAGVSQARIDSKIDAIRAQKTTNIFYLPAGGKLKEESMAMLDDVHSMPMSAASELEKLFTLSMFGFYLFVMKLSFHFCRLQENVRRRV